MIDYSKILQDIAERRIPLYCSYKLERNSLLSGLVRHHPFYRSKGYIPFTPSNHDSTKNIYDYCIVCTKDEHPILEDLSRIIYGIKNNLTDFEINFLKTILPNSAEVNKLIEISKLKNARYNIIKQLRIKAGIWFGGETFKYLWNNPNYRKLKLKQIKEQFSDPNMVKKFVDAGKATRFTQEKLSNSIWINNGINEKYILKTDTLPDGWVYGRLNTKILNEARLKNLKIARKNLLEKGPSEVFIESSRKNIQKAIKANVGRFWVTDGKNNKLLFPNDIIPPGYKIGRTFNSHSSINNK